MTFEQWLDKKLAGHDVYSLDIDDLREAWEAGKASTEDERIKMLKLLDDFDDLVSRTFPDASAYCGLYGLADRLDDLKYDI